MIKTILRKTLMAPFWCISWIFFGILYVFAWIIEFIEGDE